MAANRTILTLKALAIAHPKFFKTHLKIVDILPFKNFGTQIHYFHPPMHQIFDDTYRQDPNLILALGLMSHILKVSFKKR